MVLNALNNKILDFNDLLKTIEENRSLNFGFRRFSEADLDLIYKAYNLAKEAHANQFRKTGEPFINHPLNVAMLLVQQGMDALTIGAALVHDVVEDTKYSIDDIKEELGVEVATIVDGVTKLEHVNFKSTKVAQAASIRKMLVSMADDWRILVIKLADRLHNLRTIEVMPIVSQRRSAIETIEVYAPLAHRLGMGQLKGELEDLAFKILEPKNYYEVCQLLDKKEPEREEYLKNVKTIIETKLIDAGIRPTLSSRPKYIWSTYQKLLYTGKAIEEIYDILGIRIILDNEKDCWSTLGIVHSLWHPVPGRFKDYINVPKFNLYQSLHTTIVGPQEKLVEIQIRSWDMHFRAEYGIAAHWSYKARDGSVLKQDAAWFRRILETDHEIADPVEFLESIKLDLSKDEIYVFTPKDEIISLPSGSTPIDFAYAIHTEIGHKCIGAKVDSKLVPLSTKLRSGQKVEILVSKSPSACPSRDWLTIAVSSRARAKIRQFFLRESRESAHELGKEELSKVLKKKGLSFHQQIRFLREIAVAQGYQNEDSLLVAIGEGKVSAMGICQKLLQKAEADKGNSPNIVEPKKPGREVKSSNSIVFIDGIDDAMTRLSRCCKPIPGDEVIGYISRGRGVSVHKRSCPNVNFLLSNDPERIAEIEWNTAVRAQFIAQIEVLALERHGILADLCKMIADRRVNLISSSSRKYPQDILRFVFECEFYELGELEELMRSLKHVDNVYEVNRVGD